MKFRVVLDLDVAAPSPAQGRATLQEWFRLTIAPKGARLVSIEQIEEKNDKPRDRR